jgi:hypothetical protein
MERDLPNLSPLAGEGKKARNFDAGVIELAASSSV